ncbi:hypothetical protein [Streptomyces sp. NBC_00079]|uniref:hypothetical protein n=1 Tax=Streptomyces sp. NBC_00079 TaxID=2975644 RepID=UPI0032501E73
MSTTQVKKIATATAAGMAVVGITAAAAVASVGHRDNHAATVRESASSAARQPADRTTYTAAARPKTAVVGRGTLGGRPWSVTLEFYPTWPKGFTPPTYPERLHIPAPTGRSLLCTQSVIDGVPWQRATEPWADCEVVEGARDDGHTSGTGLRGNTDKGARGNRLLVAHPEAAVTHAAVTFRDGRRVTADVVSVPGTSYRAYAIPIATGQTIAAVDEYDAHNRLVSHDTEQR